MDSPDRWNTYTVRSSEADLQCYRTGDGPPVVLVHGWGNSGLRWVPLVKDLAEEYEVVAYDTRGHGRSDATESGYDLDTRIEDLCTVVRESGLINPILIGHSMNAATVARTAVRHPTLPRGVVLEDPDGLHDVPDDDPDERVARIRNRIEQSDGQSMEEIIAEQYPDLDPERARRRAAASLNLHPEAAEMVRSGHPSPLSEIFPDITCQTLILRSDVDIETRVLDLDAADSLPDGRLVHVPDTEHYIFDERYGAAYAELQTFLRRV